MYKYSIKQINFIILMSVVYGVISYILIIAMIVGYVLVKRWGDKEEKKYA